MRRPSCTAAAPECGHLGVGNNTSGIEIIEALLHGSAFLIAQAIDLTIVGNDLLEHARRVFLPLRRQAAAR